MTERYGTTAGFKVYHNERGNVATIADLTDTEIDSSILVASEWIDNTYRNLWPGEKLGQRKQIRDWPRSSAFDVNKDPIDYDTVPIEIERATYEAALKNAVSPGSLSVDFTPSRYQIVSVEDAIFVQYRTFTQAADIQTRFTIIDNILSVLLSGGNSLSPLSGLVKRV